MCSALSDNRPYGKKPTTIIITVTFLHLTNKIYFAQNSEGRPTAVAPRCQGPILEMQVNIIFGKIDFISFFEIALYAKHFILC